MLHHNVLNHVVDLHDVVPGVAIQQAATIQVWHFNNYSAKFSNSRHSLWLQIVLILFKH